MFMQNKNMQFPVAPQSKGNLQEIIPAAMQSAMGALGGMGGASQGGFMQGFSSAYNPNQEQKISIAPLIGQSNYARLNTLGGLVSPISGGLY